MPASERKTAQMRRRIRSEVGTSNTPTPLLLTWQMRQRLGWVPNAADDLVRSRVNVGEWQSDLHTTSCRQRRNCGHLMP